MNLRFVNLFFYLLAVSSTTTKALFSDPSSYGATESELANINLRIYPNKTLDEYTSVLIGDAASLADQIDSCKPTVFYIFGWTERPNSTSTELIISAYLQRQDHNVILVDWSIISVNSYIKVVASAKSIGKTVAKAFDELVAAGLNSNNLHIVSHSMGSQIAGFIGRNTGFKLDRITGLDPAGPGFAVAIDGLSASDARHVDVIHSDAGKYGTSSTAATVNFYPNGGKRTQPGCKKIRVPFSDDDFCDHHRSWYYYAESVLDEDAFIGVQCKSYILFKIGACSSNSKVVMGFATPSTASGSVYLRTNSESPYGRGEDGATYTS